MAVRRTRNDDDDGGLDSLLDTMTNVVGILVLVLIVTQLSVSEVVTQVMTESKVEAEDLEKVQEQLAKKQEEADELERLMVSPLDIDAEKQKEELQKKKELLERQRKLLQQKQLQKNQFAVKMAEDSQKAVQNRKLIEETQQKRVELETLVTKSLEEQARLKSLLSKTPRRAAPADIKVSIPNPRPAPPGAKEIPMVCVENKVYPLNVDGFRKRAELRAKEIIARARLVQDPIKGYDPADFKKFWEQLTDQDDYFDVSYFIADNRHLRLRFTPRTGRGGTDRQLVNPRSKVRSHSTRCRCRPTPIPSAQLRQPSRRAVTSVVHLADAQTADVLRDHAKEGSARRTISQICPVRHSVSIGDPTRAIATFGTVTKTAATSLLVRERNAVALMVAVGQSLAISNHQVTWYATRKRHAMFLATSRRLQHLVMPAHAIAMAGPFRSVAIPV